MGCVCTPPVRSLCHFFSVNLCFCPLLQLLISIPHKKGKQKSFDNGWPCSLKMSVFLSILVLWNCSIHVFLANYYPRASRCFIYIYGMTLCQMHKVDPHGLLDQIMHSWFIWATSWQNLLLSYANNKGADQPAHPRSLISTFVVHYLDSTITILAKSKISRL